MGLDLLEKTELWINNIKLKDVNLNKLASTVASVLNISEEKVLVVDVRDNHITLDILEKNIPEKNIIGKEQKLLNAIKKLDGVITYEDTFIHSNGILGMICIDENKSQEIVSNINVIRDDMLSHIEKRAIVFPTGFELRDNMIEDTNTPFLMTLLEKRGYVVKKGSVIEDDEYDMVNKLNDAINQAFGLIITTGGVGAEDKDKSIESILKLDPTAATPYIVKFEKGMGRHVKDGVRIAVGKVGPTILVALPGPNDEVRLVADSLVESVMNKCSKEIIAEQIASKLREKLIWKH
ncbi:MAG: molybdopterin-binding protein [Miniphocaeibacter sp.]|uniref:molybdopterin-binding protein n=1 Tax=Miniphocaeibacter sp. TaxID=3100973 RepID=UPI00185AF068|nr:competence/damage-inducible protein A [Gallicola sp.]